MNQKTFILIFTFVIGVASMFLPYEVREYSDSLPWPNNIGGAPFPDMSKDYYSGIRLEFPLISLAPLLLIFILLGFARNRATAIISLVFSSLHILWMPVVLFAIHFQLFSSNTIHTGIGYYMLVLVVLVQFILCIQTLVKKDYKHERRSSNDDLLLDDF